LYYEKRREKKKREDEWRETLWSIYLLESNNFLESECWGKQVLGKYFFIFSSIIKNKLKNIF
jgi:hypothetical protein